MKRNDWSKKVEGMHMQGEYLWVVRDGEIVVGMFPDEIQADRFIKSRGSLFDSLPGKVSGMSHEEVLEFAKECEERLAKRSK